MKELVIQITEADYKILRENNYTLCIAKKVEDCDFNVIWLAEKNYTQNNSITWDDKYSIFASKTMKKGQVVFENILPHEIQPGQRITLEKEGIWGNIESFGESDEMAILNQYMPVYPGLCQTCTNLSGTTSMIPFYLSPNLCIPGMFTVKPTGSIIVWFAQNVQSGLIISDKKYGDPTKSFSNFIIIDMSTNNKMIIEFDNFDWKKLSQN